MRVLVTGAAGFIGYHVSKRLLDRGDEVIGVDNLNDYYDPKLKEARLALLEGREGFRFRQSDIADRDAMKVLFATDRPQRVVNLAAQAGVRYSLINPQAYLDANIQGFLNILEGSRHHGVEHLVFASSSSVYGANTAQPFSEHHNVDHPVSLYAATKKANELMAHSYSHLFGLPTTGLRFFTVYGPWGRPDQAPMLFTKAIVEGRPIDVFNGGDMARDFTYIDDVVEGVVRVLERPPTTDDCTAPYAIYNIGNHEAVRLDAFIALLEQLLGRRALRNERPMQPGDVKATYASIERLRRATGFAPSTPLADGLARFVAWYRDYHAVT
jgi:UDP-glucuronate 4-epimerase